MAVIDFRRFIYEFLTQEWDQSGYPADIWYHDPTHLAHQSSEHIVLEVDAGITTTNPLGLKISPSLYSQIVHVYLTAKDISKTREELANYEHEVREVLKDLLATIHESITTTWTIENNLHDGHYEIAGAKKVLTSALCQCGISAGTEVARAILLYPVDVAVGRYSDYVTVTSATFRVYVQGASLITDEGFNIYLIDEDFPAYSDNDPGEPDITGDPVAWPYTDGTGWQTSSDIASIITAYLARDRTVDENRVGLYIKCIADGGVDSDYFYFSSYPTPSQISDMTVTFTYDLDIQVNRILRDPVRDCLDFWLMCKEID